MLKINHTPGPWENDGCYIVAPCPIGNFPDIYIAEIAYEDSEGRIASLEQQVANGNLIAASPEMLEALQLAQQALEAMPDFLVHSAGMTSYQIAAEVQRVIAMVTKITNHK